MSKDKPLEFIECLRCETQFVIQIQSDVNFCPVCGADSLELEEIIFPHYDPKYPMPT